MGSGWRLAAVFKGAFALTWVALTALALLPLPSAPLPSDKVSHVLAYFALAFTADFAFPSRPFWLAKGLPLFTYGVVVELVQRGVPGRYGEAADVVANLVGLAAFALSLPLWKRFPVLRERWATSSPRAGEGT